MEFCKAQAAGGREWIGEAMQARHFVSDRGHRASCLVQHSISPGTQTSRAIQKSSEDSASNFLICGCHLWTDKRSKSNRIPYRTGMNNASSLRPIGSRKPQKTQRRAMILIASAATNILAGWEQALEGFAGVLAVQRFDALNETLRRMTPRLLLLDLDLPGLDGIRSVAALRKTDPPTRIIAFTNAVSDEVEIALFKLGVRGCAMRDIEPQLLKRIVAAIEEGELWIRRSITPRLVDEIGARPQGESNVTRGTGDRFDILTEREREIATLIGNGESNKQIARALYITERTVKSHLTGIFRKLGVADRVRLALRVASRSDSARERIS